MFRIAGDGMKKYIDLEDMVNLNCSNVLDIIQKNKEISRKEIIALSGLSWGGMTKIVNRLLEHGYVTEKKAGHIGGGGRTPSVLSVNSDRNFVIGLDINKTGLNAIVMNLTGETLKSYSAKVTSDNRDDFVDEVVSFVKKAYNDFKDKNVISTGVAMQGTVDSQNGISVKMPGIDGWNNVEIKKILENETGGRVFVEHDPDCLLYPHTQNSLRENTVLLRIDKSVGMAVAVNGKIIRATGIFEIAHTIAVPNGKKCRCGQQGCLEAYVGGCITDDGIDKEKSAELIMPLAVTVKNLADIFRADRFILTGTLMEHTDFFESRLTDELSSLGFATRLEFCAVSDYAMRGAALRAINKSINSLMF